MGVHGLTTYLRESKRNLSTTRSLPAEGTVHFIIDGWSFIYELQLKSGLPWVYGGEYVDFVRLVTTVVQAWINVGVRVSFVFDGPLPELKFATQISRAMKSHIEPSLLFFRTSSVSRVTPRFLNESRIIPPLLYSATVHALQQLKKTTDAVDVHFADEEGDPYAVELAGRLGGYVVGNDSDFVILNSEGYLGYVPMDEMVWTSLTKDTETLIGGDDNEGDFQQVPVSKRKKRQMQMKDPKLGRSIIPPDNTASSDLSFTFTAYSPASLASHLDLPITLLPLLGALVGNDFSNQSRKRIQELFFGRQMTLIQRILLAAETLRTTLSGGSQAKRRPKQQVSSVMDLIQKTVQTLLSRSPAVLSPGEVDGIVDGIVVSTLQYAISAHDGQDGSLWPSTLCGLHEPDVCPMLPMFSRHLAAVDWQEEDMEGKVFLNEVQARKLLLEAYRNGRISPNVINCLNTGTLWPRLFLECPDVETVSHITRPIRHWCCSILDDAVGLPESPEEEEASPAEGVDAGEDVSDEDELIDVVEENSDADEENEDLLAPLRGALQQLHVKPDSKDEQPPTASDVTSQLTSSSAPRMVRITEYVRRGTRLADEVVEIPFLGDLLEGCTAVDNTSSTPLLLQSQNQRLAVLLHALKGNSSFATLPSNLVAPTLAMRWVVHSLHEKAQQSRSKEAQNACWTRREARCFLALFSSRNKEMCHPTSALSPTSFPEIVERHVQLTAQVLQALEAVEQLSQVLLLTEPVPAVAHWFSGRQFHEYLTGIVPLEDHAVPEEYWTMAIEGLEQCLSEDRQKKKKGNGGQSVTAVAAPLQKSSGKAKAGSRGLFDLLGDMDA
ncbi:PIN domain-like protein [Marasmius fiardii PR-910]|nr:PIN domain-like protein [Marasmius fiardii PR-910]